MNKQHDEVAEVGQVWLRERTNEEFTILDTKYYISRGETLYIGVYADRKDSQWASYYESKLNREFVCTDKRISMDTVKKFKISRKNHSEQFDNDVQEIAYDKTDEQYVSRELLDVASEEYKLTMFKKEIEEFSTEYLENMAYVLNKQGGFGDKLDIVLDVLQERAANGSAKPIDKTKPLAKLFKMLDYTHLFKSNSGLWKAVSK